jgi:hypothetical protein
MGGWVEGIQIHVVGDRLIAMFSCLVGGMIYVDMLSQLFDWLEGPVVDRSL